MDSLSGQVVGAVLFGALLQAAWNALVKSGRDKALDTALVHGLAALIALPFVLWLGPPRPAAWPCLGASLAIHIGYDIARVGASRAFATPQRARAARTAPIRFQ